MRLRSALFATLSATLLTLLTSLPMLDSPSPLPSESVSAHGEPQVPAPAECRVAPRPLADVAATAQGGGSASSVTGTTETNESTDATPFIMPAGAPVDDLTRGAVVATVVEMLACENAGDRLRAYALHSDAFLQRQFGQLAAGSPDGAWLDTFSTPPAPRPETARNALLSIEGMRVIPDGRVGALVHVNRTDDA